MVGSFRVSMRRLLLLVVVFALIAWIGRGAQEARKAAYRACCNGNLCQIGVAFHNYHRAYGSFPPAYLTDAQGKPVHSWRVLLLPFLGEQTLYDAYKFNESWDGPNNSKLAAFMPHTYACPNHRGDFRGAAYRGTRWTSYVALVGPGTVFPGGKPVKLSEITDGPSNTIMLAEVADVDIPWMAPRDLEASPIGPVINGPGRSGISSKDGDGATFLFADGSRRWLDQRLPACTLQSLITRAGGEAVDWEALGH
jgi:hypothetical protein